MGRATAFFATAIGALLAGPALALDMCSAQPCALSIGLGGGGSIAAASGATLTFGPGGALALGDGGSITLGEGGSITPAPAEGAAVDMSEGGSVVLGPGGSISFGPAGSLITGDQGGVTLPEGAVIDIVTVGSFGLQSAGDVHVGALDSDRDIHVSSGGSVLFDDSLRPINVTADGAGADITIAADGDVTMGEISSGGSVLIEAQGDITAEGESPPSDGGGGDGSAEGGITLTTTGGTATCNACGSNVTIVEPVQLSGSASNGGTGSPGGTALLLLAGVAWMRRRRAG